jgi:hypothetical protein
LRIELGFIFEIAFEGIKSINIEIKITNRLNDIIFIGAISIGT